MNEKKSLFPSSIVLFRSESRSSGMKIELVLKLLPSTVNQRGIREENKLLFAGEEENPRISNVCRWVHWVKSINDLATSAACCRNRRRRISLEADEREIYTVYTTCTLFSRRIFDAIAKLLLDFRRCKLVIWKSCSGLKTSWSTFFTKSIDFTTQYC